MRGANRLADLLQQFVEPLTRQFDLAGQQREIQLGLFRAQRRLVEPVGDLGEVASQGSALGLERAPLLQLSNASANAAGSSAASRDEASARLRRALRAAPPGRVC